MKSDYLPALPIAILCAFAPAPSSAETLNRSVVVSGDPARVWAAIGSFCAIADWHPAIASCASDGRTPPTRTLVTKDGARFVELQTARHETQHEYSYAFTSSPIPVTGYSSTLKVSPSANGASVINWSGTYTPNPGKATDAEAALSGIYESGLAAIKAKLAR